VIHEAVLAACDAADGVKDRLISDPPRCHFDPKVIQCTGADGPSCLTPAQVQSVRIAMSPATSPKTGAKVFFGYEPGSELMWTAVMNGQPARYALEGFRDVVYNDPNWDWRTFDLDRDLAKANEVDKGMTSAVDPDLTKFAGRGGKLLMYHGWSDGAIPPGASVSYYTSVVKRMGGAAKTDRWVRLFMAPGMGHCGLGDGPNTFDLVTPLDEWVTHGKAPDRIIAARIADGKTERTRPLCPYPQVAAYKGTGSTDDAVNFICRTR
jgi:tannase/feruloyl esterase